MARRPPPIPQPRALAKATGIGNNCAFHCLAHFLVKELLDPTKSLADLERLYQQPAYQAFLKSMAAYYKIENVSISALQNIFRKYTNPIDREIILGPVLRLQFTGNLSPTYIEDKELYEYAKEFGIKNFSIQRPEFSGPVALFVRYDATAKSLTVKIIDNNHWEYLENDREAYNHNRAYDGPNGYYQMREKIESFIDPESKNYAAELRARDQVVKDMASRQNLQLVDFLIYPENRAQMNAKLGKELSGVAPKQEAEPKAAPPLARQGSIKILADQPPISRVAPPHATQALSAASVQGPKVPKAEAPKAPQPQAAAPKAGLSEEDQIRMAIELSMKEAEAEKARQAAARQAVPLPKAPKVVVPPRAKTRQEIEEEQLNQALEESKREAAQAAKKPTREQREAEELRIALETSRREAIKAAKARRDFLPEHDHKREIAEPKVPASATPKTPPNKPKRI